MPPGHLSRSILLKKKKGGTQLTQTIQCGSETGPSPEWMVQHTLTPGDLRDLQVELVKTSVAAEEFSILMNISWILRADGCLNHVMKYKKQCTEAGSLWDPDITACKKNEKMVEVNFTTNPLGNRYTILIQRDTTLGFSRVLENKLMRTSVAIPVTEESEGAVVQLTPYLHTCGNDCIRREGTVVLCSETSAPIPPDDRRSTKTSFPISTMLLPLIKVLVVYPSEICFHHTVCRFTDFLQNYCRSEVILEKWQKKKIAEMGPVQWLTTQKQAADKVVFLLPSDVPTLCDSACGHNEGSARENSQDLFPLAFNLFCSDFSSQTHLHKYLVVYLGGADLKGDYNALSVCPQYHLMKDATAFHTELLKATQSMSVKKRSQACHDSCSPL